MNIVEPGTLATPSLLPRDISIKAFSGMVVVGSAYY